MTASSSSSQVLMVESSEAASRVVAAEGIEAFDSSSFDGVSCDGYESSQDSDMDHSLGTEQDDGHSAGDMDSDLAHSILGMDDDDKTLARLDAGRLQYGYVHYRRRCRIRAPVEDREQSKRARREIESEAPA